MAAIAWQMGYKTGDHDAILKGGNDAFNAVPSADAIARSPRTSACPPKYGEFKLDKTDKQDKGASSSRATASRTGSAATAWPRVP